MAYLAFDEPVDLGAATIIAPPAPPAFTALEWSIVALAEHDPLSSLRAPGRIAMALGALFGDRANPGLADRRLEALRRMAVLLWRRAHDLPADAAEVFFAAGFTPGQLDLLSRSIEGARRTR